MKSTGLKMSNLTALVLAALLSAGCIPLAIEAGKKAWEDRSTEDQVTDGKIYGGILSRLSDKDKNLLLDVSADVWEGRVLLTGTLDSRKAHREVVSLVRRDKRIRKLYDEVRIVTKAEKERRRKQREARKGKKEEGGAVDDFWIETKISARLLTTKGVTSVNFRWRSVGYRVFTIGRARSVWERDTVLRVIRETKGVKSVKHFIQVKPLKK